MNLFVEKYLSIIYEQQGNTEITLEEYHKFIMSAVKFDENLNVISEHLDNKYIKKAKDEKYA